MPRLRTVSESAWRRNPKSFTTASGRRAARTSPDHTLATPRSDVGRGVLDGARRGCVSMPMAWDEITSSGPPALNHLVAIVASRGIPRALGDTRQPPRMKRHPRRKADGPGAGSPSRRRVRLATVVAPQKGRPSRGRSGADDPKPTGCSSENMPTDRKKIPLARLTRMRAETSLSAERRRVDSMIRHAGAAT